MGWFISTITMEYSDFIMVIGDLPQMVENLCETGVQTMVIIRLFMFKFHKLVNQIMIFVQNDVSDENYSNLEERKIYIVYSSKAAYFCKVSLWFCASTSVAWYLDPWQQYLLACNYINTFLFIYLQSLSKISIKIFARMTI